MIKLIKALGKALLACGVIGGVFSVRYVSIVLLIISLGAALFGLFVLKMGNMAEESELENSELEVNSDIVINTDLEETEASVENEEVTHPEVKQPEISQSTAQHETTKPTADNFYEYSEAATAFNKDGTPYIHVYGILNVGKIKGVSPGACIIERENGRLTLHKSRVDINALLKRNLDSSTVKVYLLYQDDFPIVEYDELGVWLEYCIRNNYVNRTSKASVNAKEKEQYEVIKTLQFRDKVKGDFNE